MAAPRVFVSHASADEAFANRLSDDLRRVGADVWLDSSHMGAGDFVARINAALAGRDVVVLVLTPTAIQSQWVNREVNAALARENQGLMRPMIVIVAQPCDLSAIPPLWTVYHRYDATRDYLTAVNGVMKELGFAAHRLEQPVTLQSVTPPSMPAMVQEHLPLPAAPTVTKTIMTDMLVSPSRVTVAAITVFAVYLILIYATIMKNVLLQFIPIQNTVWYVLSAVLLVIVFPIIAQAIGVRALWNSVQKAWEQLGHKPRHPWLAGAFAFVEILSSLILYLQIEGIGAFQSTQAIFGAIFPFVVSFITLLAGLALIAIMRQARWLFYLLVPLLSGLVAYLLPRDLSGPYITTDSLFTEMIFYGFLITWMFVMLVFALIGSARKSEASGEEL